MPQGNDPPGGGFVDSRARRNLRWALGAFFSTVGVAHFVSPGVFERMIPPYLPAAHALVLISGVAEIAGGAGLVVPGLRRWAAWGLLALLVAVFPANLHMALNPEGFGDIGPAWALWVRLPFQPLLMWAVWRSALTSALP